MAMAVIAIVLICIGAVSATEEIQDGNLTVDNSQDEKIVIDEDSQADMSFKTESDIIGATSDDENLDKSDDEDILSSPVITDGNGKSGTINDYKVNDEVTIMFSGGSQLSNYYLNVDGSQYGEAVNTGFMGSTGQFTYKFTQAKTYSICIKDAYGDTSNILSFVVSGGTASTTETAVTLTVPSSGTVNTAVNIPYSVTEKGSTTGVSSGTLTFYDGTTQIGNPITLTSSSGTFTYTFTRAKTYNIKAVYTAATGYEDSESSVSQIVVSDSGNSGESESNIKLTISEGISGGYYAFTDDYALIPVAANEKYPTTVNFEVTANSTLSSPKIKFGTDKNNLNQEKSVSGSYSLIFSSGTNSNADVNSATGKTYYVQIVDGNSKSNIVAVNVKQSGSTISSLDLDPYYGTEGNSISTKLVNVEYSGYSYTFVGNATFYSSNSYNKNTRLGTVSTDGGTLLIPNVENAGGCCVWTTLYYVFSGIRNDGAGTFKTGQIYFIGAYANTISLTSNGATGTIDVTSDTIPLDVSSTYYLNDGTKSYYEIYIDDSTTSVGTFTVASTSSVNTYNLDVSGLESGEHEVYVKYLGYWDGTNEDYYADGESNHLTINIAGTAPATDEISVSVTNTTYGNTIATVTSGQAGSYILKINNIVYGDVITFTRDGSQEISITGYAASSNEYTATIVDTN